MVTPMLAAYFLKPHAHKEIAEGRMMRGYTKLVTWAVRYRFITVILGLALFALALVSARKLPSGFLPVADISRSLLAIELPPGSELSDTQAVTDVIASRAAAAL